MRRKKDENISVEEMRRRNIEYEYKAHKSEEKFNNFVKNILIVILIFGLILLGDLIRMILESIFK